MSFNFDNPAKLIVSECDIGGHVRLEFAHTVHDLLCRASRDRFYSYHLNSNH